MTSEHDGLPPYIDHFPLEADDAENAEFTLPVRERQSLQVGKAGLIKNRASRDARKILRWLFKMRWADRLNEGRGTKDDAGRDLIR